MITARHYFASSILLAALGGLAFIFAVVFALAVPGRAFDGAGLMMATLMAILGISWPLAAISFAAGLVKAILG